jgi:hypothetical protein
MAYKGRLLPEALYEPRDAEIHRIRAARVNGPKDGDVEDHEGTWRRAPKRIAIIDPLGLRSHALATEVESDLGVRK